MMLRTIPVIRNAVTSENTLKTELRIYQGYHLAEMKLNSNCIDLVLVKGEDRIETRFMHPVPVDPFRPSVSRSSSGREELVIIKARRGTGTQPGAHPSFTREVCPSRSLVG